MNGFGTGAHKTLVDAFLYDCVRPLGHVGLLRKHRRQLGYKKTFTISTDALLIDCEVNSVPFL